MRKRPLIGLLLLTIAAAAPVGAQLVKFKDWDKSPEFMYLATEQEKNDWKSVQTDAAAEKQFQRFWARRDPDLKTGVNEFKVKWDTRVGEVTRMFPLVRTPGYATERGHLVLLVGLPTRSTRRSLGDFAGETQVGQTGATAVVRYLQTLTYEKKDLPPWAEMEKLEVSFEVDEGLGRETMLAGREAAKKLEAKAAEMALVNPQIQEVQTREEADAKAAAQKAAEDAAAEAKRGPTLSPAVREALQKTFGEPKGPLAIIALVGRDGQPHAELQMSVPTSQVTAPESAKLAILIRTKADGKDAARREEPAALQKSKNDYFADRTIVLEPGEYEAAMALMDAAGAVIASATRPLSVPPRTAEFAVSGLLLAYNDYAVEGSKPDDPFVFAQRKFVSPRDGQFDMSDALSYIVRVYNPAIDPTTKKIVLSKTGKIKPKNGTAIDVPASRDEFTPGEVKEGMITFIDVGANIVEKIGDYFQPGEYTLRVTVADVTSGKSFEVTAPYKVVGAPKSPARK